jgi:hypothetical protein
MATLHTTLLPPYNFWPLLYLSKEHRLREQPYTYTAQPTCKTLCRVMHWQLMTAQNTELLDGNNANVSHGSRGMRLVILCLV